jgi:hypothetical protein
MRACYSRDAGYLELSVTETGIMIVGQQETVRYVSSALVRAEKMYILPRVGLGSVESLI